MSNILALENAANELLARARKGEGKHKTFQMPNRLETLALGGLNGIKAVKVDNNGTFEATPDAPEKVTGSQVIDGLINLGSPMLTAGIAATLNVHPLATLAGAHTHLDGPVPKVDHIFPDLDLDAFAEALVEVTSKLLTAPDFPAEVKHAHLKLRADFPSAVAWMCEEEADVRVSCASLPSDPIVEVRKMLATKRGPAN